MYTSPILREDRQLVLIDIENLTGTPNPTIHEVRLAKAAIACRCPSGPNALWVVACRQRAAMSVLFEFPNARRIVSPDHVNPAVKLEGVLSSEQVERRFDCVVICSGNETISTQAARLAGHGVEVAALVGEGRLATRLRLAVRESYSLQQAIEPSKTGTGS